MPRRTKRGGKSKPGDRVGDRRARPKLLTGTSGDECELFVSSAAYCHAVVPAVAALALLCEREHSVARVPPVWPMVLRAARSFEVACTNASRVDEIELFDRRRIMMTSNVCALYSPAAVEELFVAGHPSDDAIRGMVPHLRALTLAERTSLAPNTAGNFLSAHHAPLMCWLTKLSVEDGEFHPGHEEGLKLLTNLTWLSLALSPRLTNAVLDEALANLTSLRWLELCGTRVSDIHFVGVMPYLEHLGLSNTPVQDLSPAAACVRLTEFEVAKCAGVNFDVVIAALPHLRTLVAGQHHCLDPLSGHPSLTKLTAWDHDHNVDHIMRVVPTLLALEEISLGWSFITSLQGYDALTKLKRGDFRMSAITDDDMTILAKVTSLEYLNLFGTSVTQLSPLRHLPCLTELNYADQMLQDVVDCGLHEGFPALRTLHLELTPDLRRIGALKGLAALETVDVSHSWLSERPEELRKQLLDARFTVIAHHVEF